METEISGEDVVLTTDRTYDDVESLKKPFVKGDDSRGSKGARSRLKFTYIENTLGQFLP